MSRKVKNIIFYIFVGAVFALFLLSLIVGGIYGIAGAGSRAVIGMRNFFISLGNSDASFVKHSACIESSIPELINLFSICVYKCFFYDF